MTKKKEKKERKSKKKKKRKKNKRPRTRKPAKNLTSDRQLQTVAVASPHRQEGQPQCVAMMVSPTITNDNNNNNISINSRSFKTLLCSKVASDSPGVTKCEKAGDDYDDDCDHGNDEDEDDVNNNNDKWETTLRRDQDIFQESLRKAPGPW
eukprot:CAMPEP_0206471956 /NCGR_PEP_ID=MMETSP0324_2-20121206/31888_1 /ASSEMBLY_ACC=CAM_ASM_000836 /TAXON_ID=2866 /ORGANISM="Crypthecodinium cohnii, Strain Seligo" /LENGTH=150 /DNA_ID=CAMNT_0053946413 /DNA_START=436 /DNA_END=889 /DNA_ORIENTATION=-